MIMQGERKTRFRVLLNSISALVFLTFLFNSPFAQNWISRNGFMQKIPKTSSNFTIQISGYIKNGQKGLMDPQICDDFITHEGFLSPCDYLLAHPDCNSGGFLNYMKFLFCDCKNHLFFWVLYSGFLAYYTLLFTGKHSFRLLLLFIRKALKFAQNVTNNCWGYFASLRKWGS